MRRRKQHSGQTHGHALAPRNPNQPRHEVIIQKKLLINRPQHIPRDMLEVGLIQRMQHSKMPRQRCAHHRHQQRRRKNPQRRHKPAQPESKLVPGLSPRQHNRQRHHQRHRRQQLLRILGHPDHKHDEAVAENQLDKIARNCSRTFDDSQGLHKKSMSRKENQEAEANAV